MCGISGIISLTSGGRNSLPLIHNAVAAMNSRGPDCHGVLISDTVALGHNRLSVIDVSEAASQPFSDPSGRYTIIFNGEFFNFKPYREQLIQKGISLRSTSDTEVLLHLYMLEGPACVEKINGFFAFAIYDRREETVFIARDRMGIKPLLVYSDQEKIMFASEMKALIAMNIPKEINREALYCYLQMNYIPGGRSIFKNVRRLDPGSYLMIKNGKAEQEQFYQIPYDPQLENRVPVSYDAAQKEVIRLLNESVEKRLISDVPLGAFLSGGVDSSVIVALAASKTSHLKTFSIGYRDEPFFDETRYAKLVAEKYKTDHTVFQLSNDDLYETLFNVLDYTDEPFADSSAIAVNILCRHTRKHVTVALSGDGADELFGGYMKHVAEWRVRHAGITGSLLGFSAPLWHILPQSRNNPITNRFRQISRYADGLRLDEKNRYWRWCSFAGEDQVSRLLLGNPDVTAYENIKHQVTSPISKNGPMNEVFLADMKHVLVNDMLIKTDLMSMNNSLEVRVPFLDYELVNYVFSLPSDYKIMGNFRKKILQDACRSLLPAEIYQRPKHGFEVPLLGWLRKGLRHLIEDDLLNDEFIENQGIFNVIETKKLKKRLQSQNPGDVASRIWGLIVFQYWWKKHLAGSLIC